jgi:Helix-turn-helix domain
LSTEIDALRKHEPYEDKTLTEAAQSHARGLHDGWASTMSAAMNQAAQPKEKFSFAKRWTPELLKEGHVQISTFFLENYHCLKPYDLTHGEAMFVIHLMKFKWGEDAPYPAYKTVAQQMGVSTKTARRLAASLQQKKYLHREVRRGATNRFHLQKLMAALVALKKGEKVPPKAAKRAGA